MYAVLGVGGKVVVRRRRNDWLLVIMAIMVIFGRMVIFGSLVVDMGMGCAAQRTVSGDAWCADVWCGVELRSYLLISFFLLLGPGGRDLGL